MKLLYYSLNGNTKGIEELLDEGIDINYRGDFGERKNWTALMFACRFSNTTSSLDTVKLLLERGAYVNLKTNDGYTALMIAVRSSNIGSSLETVKEILKYKVNVNSKNKYGWTALMMASKNSNRDSTYETVKLLLEYGVDVNLKSSEGFSALMLATDFSNISSSLDTVKLLLKYGADPFDKIFCPTEECQKIIDEARWKQLYERDKETAFRYSKNSQDSLPKDVWEIILLENRRQQLCQNLSSEKNKEILKLFAIELGIEITNNMTKAQLCGFISSQLVYGKENKYKNKSKNELDKNAKQFLVLAKKFGIDTDRSLHDIIKDIANLYDK